jgi:hypothetical protein
MTYLYRFLKILDYFNKQVDVDGKKRKAQRRTCPSATLSTTNPTWTDPGVNLGLRIEGLATNCLNHGMAVEIVS